LAYTLLLGTVPIAAQQASPVTGAGAVKFADGVTSTPLLRAAGIALPPPPGILALARFVFAPGTSFPDLEVPGPELIVVEAGTVTVQVPGEDMDDDEAEELAAWVTPATPGASRVEIVEKGLAVFKLHVGDQLAIPPDTKHLIENDEAEPATYLAVALTPPAPSGGGPLWPPAGVTPDELPSGINLTSLDLGYRAVTELPGGRGVVTLDRIVYEPAVGLTDRLSAGPQLWFVETGNLSLSTTGGKIEVARPTRDAALVSPLATPTEDVTLKAGDAVLIHPGTVSSVSNTGSTPLTLLVLTVTSFEADAGSPPAATPPP
jgi:quercetin dioxygenase-like cupin family protein